MDKINQHNDSKKQEAKLFKRVNTNSLFKIKSCSLHVKNFEVSFQSSIKRKNVSIQIIFIPKSNLIQLIYLLVSFGYDIYVLCLNVAKNTTDK